MARAIMAAVLATGKGLLTTTLVNGDGSGSWAGRSREAHKRDAKRAPMQCVTRPSRSTASSKPSSAAWPPSKGAHRPRSSSRLVV